jgi:Domain of unknown function (DUF6484)
VSRVDVDVNQKVVGEETVGTDAIGSIGTKSDKSYSAHGGELPRAGSLPSATIGRLAAIRPAVGPLVDFPSNTSGALVSARSAVNVTENDVGREVALVFEDGDSARPIIIGVMQGVNHPDGAHPAQVTLDEDTLILTAKKEVVIRCGKASITLTSAGKLLILGEYVVSRSSGVNKIRGGSVQIN